jgi:hypothetical protein
LKDRFELLISFQRVDLIEIWALIQDLLDLLLRLSDRRRLWFELDCDLAVSTLWDLYDGQVSSLEWVDDVTVIWVCNSVEDVLVIGPRYAPELRFGVHVTPIEHRYVDPIGVEELFGHVLLSLLPQFSGEIADRAPFTVSLRA